MGVENIGTINHVISPVNTASDMHIHIDSQKLRHKSQSIIFAISAMRFKSKASLALSLKPVLVKTSIVKAAPRATITILYISDITL